MGCGLRKLKPSEESSPGKIYSTLKRPQVETKVGVAYTYQYVDFLVGKDGKTCNVSETIQWLFLSRLKNVLNHCYSKNTKL
ncbi:unnamed protein product [Oncorhynchus mykiss]|uniref:Uncharacterized protein n=1 Tax=Oncorhynchus mykiss TaxID=8022 RepID=A0A060ZA64_ONCMY|nr:unnamed protein product [Oncorhynchus mykiss]